MADTKYCESCDTTKPVSEFYKASWSEDGLRQECKRCHKLRVRSYRKEVSWSPYGDPRNHFIEKGQRFGKGVVIELQVRIGKPTNDHPNGKRGVRLLCDCGNVYEATTGHLSGEAGTQSCGCARRVISSQEEIEYVQELLDEGFDVSSIARELGIIAAPIYAVKNGTYDI